MLVWLSVLLLAPFPFSSWPTANVPERIAACCNTALRGHCERLHRAAALCLARLIAREDIVENHVKKDFFSQLSALSISEDSNATRWSCVLVAHQLSKLPTLRNMPNNELTAIVQAAISAWELPGSPRKIMAALCGRLSTELVERECPDDVRQARQQWRYHQTGGRRLSCKFLPAAPSDGKKMGEMTVGDFSMRESVQSLVEDVIGDILLPSLEDPVTVVRWTAAKALGRISNALPSAAAVDVFTALTRDNDDGIKTLGNAHRLHGTSLAIAELIRRLGSTALAFDSPASLGALLSEVAKPAFECQGLAAARDAACFITWAVARGVCDREVVRKNLDMILRLLVCSSLLDPNIIVRRAASAAAQEIVGRLGCVSADDPGFLFVNLVDYWTVANRVHAATTLLGEVASKLSRSDSDLVPFVLDHLYRLHLRSTDKRTRELAARSVGALVPFVDDSHLSEFIEDRLLPACLEETTTHPTIFRHGALLGVSEVVVACEELINRDESRSGKILDTNTATLIRNVVPKLEKARLYRGRGGEMIRAAACSLMQAVFYARSCIALKPNTIPRYIQSINSSIRHFTAAVQIAAAEALMTLVVCRPSEITSDEIGKIGKEYIEKLEVADENVAARRGYVLALALITRARKTPPEDPVVSLFVREANAWPTHPISKDLVDAETRRWAVLGLLGVVQSEVVVDAVVETLIRCVVVDYATDSRGDVGRWVREGSVRGVSEVLAGRSMKSFVVDSCLAALISASVSRLDHVRVVAISGIEDIIVGRGCRGGGPFEKVYATVRKNYEAPPRIDSLQLPSNAVTTSQLRWPALWGDILELYRGKEKMNVFRSGLTSMRKFPAVRDKLVILSSVVSSAGSLSHGVAQEASEALISLLKEDEVFRCELAELLLILRQEINTVAVFPTKADRDSRFSIPWLTTMELLLARDLLVLNENEVSEVVKGIVAELRGSRSVAKLRECAVCLSTVYFGILPVSAETKTEIELALFGRLLCHEFPKIRHATAKTIYEKSLLCASRRDEDMFDIIIETDWTADEVLWKEVHLKICERIGVEAVVEQEAAMVKMREPYVFGYADFVREEYR